MAENKKSFILYADLLSVVEKIVLKDRENKTNYGGELFLHILKYVNDMEPVAIDFIIEMAFEPIKLQLKRDLKKYELIKKKRSDAGKMSAETRQQASTKSTSVEFVEQTSTNSTDNDNVNDTVNVNEIKDLSGEKSFLVPKMQKIFKEKNPQYPTNDQKDYEPLLKISSYIAEIYKLPKNILAQSEEDKNEICRRWGDMSDFISGEKLYKKFSLMQIEKYFQSIHLAQNGNSKDTTRPARKMEFDRL